MKKISSPFGKSLASAAVFTLCFQASIAHGAALDISQSPLMLVDSVAPNIIFTLDDSGSMEFSYAPDGLGDSEFEVNGIEICPDSSNGCRNTRRVKSSVFNPLYYNPDVTYILPKKADGNTYSTSFASAPWNGFTGSSKINLSKNYRPAWHNNWNNNTKYANHPNIDFNNTTSGTKAYYYVYDESQNNCGKVKHDDDCYRLERVKANEEQNFATWYSFYRNRGLATLSAAHLAFFELPSSVRFTWQEINGNNNLSGNFDIYSQDHKSDFYDWLKRESFSGATPLLRAMKRAGDFLTTNKAWENEIGKNNSGKHTCRPAYHIMMADGMWNGDKPDQPKSYKHDNKSWSTPDGTSYSPMAPYKHDESHTLADLAMHYWATDLHSIADEVKPFTKFGNANKSTEYWDARNNPATWQHMVNFTVGLGLTGSLVEGNVLWEDDKGTFDSSGYHNILKGTSWPDVGGDVSTNNGKVYDLWHAAINSRGEFFSADSPEALIQSFKDILNRIAERTSTAAAAGSSTSVSADDPDDPYNLTIVNRAFFPEYDSEDWSGDVKRYDIIRSSNGNTQRELIWSARDLLTSAAGRNIKMTDKSADNGLQEFAYSNLSNDLKKVFNTDPDASGSTTDNEGAARVNYLKGDRSKEGSGSNHFRIRGSVLGDIINSTPAVVGAPSYIPYIADKIDGSAGDYLDFLTTNKNRHELVYVGSNGGMLHAFSAESGNEIFAFAPTATLKHMPKLTGQSYKGGAHRFFVDGSPVVRDVYFDNAWHTVLIGTLGAGGRSIFALDITNPGDNGNGIKLLWEITEDSDGYENLGYSFPEPEIVRLHSGEWALLQGNGYNSEDDIASLLIIDIEDGTLIREISVDDGENGPNGLSSVRGADNNGDGIVDYAYAGDLQGNLWRFDLIKTINDDVADPFSREVQTSITAQHYSVSYGGSPLFQATYPAASNETRIQAITSPPSLVRHPTRRGYIVMFGTGKYFETDDAAPDTSKANSIYGIWDRLTKAQKTGSADAGTLTRNSLQQQTIEEQKVTSFNGAGQTSISRTVRYISDNPVKWYVDNTTPEEEAYRNKVNKWGWFVDLQVGNARKGEMMTERMVARGDTLLFGTLTPNEDPCADGAGYWAYALNAHTGARTAHSTFDFNQDGSFDRKDTDNGKAPSGYESQSPISLTRDGSVIDIGGAVGFATDPDLQGRQSWQTMPLEIEQ